MSRLQEYSSKQLLQERDVRVQRFFVADSAQSVADNLKKFSELWTDVDLVNVAAPSLQKPMSMSLRRKYWRAAAVRATLTMASSVASS